MKKLIGSLSCVLIMGCALALANANDDVNATNGTSDMNSQSAPNAMTHQEPGTAADTSGNMNSESTTTTSTTTNKTTAMNKKSCTDSNGNVIKKGHTGFKACVKAKKDQMGGTADDSMNKIDDSSGSSNNQ